MPDTPGLRRTGTHGNNVSFDYGTMPDTLTYAKAIEEVTAGLDEAFGDAPGDPVWAGWKAILAHIDAMTEAARKFFGGARWQYHDDYAHVLLVELDELRDALLSDEEPHDA